VTKNNNASVRGVKRVELQKTYNDLDRRHTELVAEFEAKQRGTVAESQAHINGWVKRASPIFWQRTRIGIQLEVLDELPKPGFAPTRTEKDRQLRQECLQDFPAVDDEKLAIRRFIKRRGGDRRRAANVWSRLKGEDKKVSRT
jgi:hypothetical protein